MMAKRRLILVRDADEMKADELGGAHPLRRRSVARDLPRLRRREGRPAPQVLHRVQEARRAHQARSALRAAAARLRARRGARRAAWPSRPTPPSSSSTRSAPSSASSPTPSSAWRSTSGERKQITADDVEQGGGHHPPAQRLRAGQRRRCGRSRAGLARAGLDARRARIGRAHRGHAGSPLRQLWITSELLERTRDKFEIAQALGIPPFFVDDIDAPGAHDSTRRAPSACTRRSFVADKHSSRHVSTTRDCSKD